MESLTPSRPTLSRYVLFCLLVVALLGCSSCAAIAGIFKAGVWVGVIIAVFIVGGAVALISLLR